MNYSYYLENMNILWTKICFDLFEIATKFLTCLKLSYMLKHKTENKMIHSESDFSFAINSVSDFDSASESNSENLLTIFFYLLIFLKPTIRINFINPTLIFPKSK